MNDFSQNSKTAISFEHILVDDDWFYIQKINDHLFAISEPRHYEHTIIYLLIGTSRAIVIDTGCGIGDLRHVVEQLTSHPVTVINTHTHLDHLGSNRQFSDIMMFDHPLSRLVSKRGARQSDVSWELLDEKLITLPWPKSFQRDKVMIPPFEVSRWLKHGEIIEIDDFNLEILHTPGEAPDHICLLERNFRILFCGDILLDGDVWVHLDGGDIGDLSQSYQLLMEHYDSFDCLMPCHNIPGLDKGLLPVALAGSKKVQSGKVEAQSGSDPWGRQYKKYDFDQISILTK